jgi:hypothetical protein
MDILLSDVATAVPPTVYSTMMPQGATEDNRRERVPRNTSTRPTSLLNAGGFSIEALTGIIEANFERARPQRELMEDYMRSSMDLNVRSISIMESFVSTRERMLQNSEHQYASFERVSASLGDRMNTLIEMLGNRREPPAPHSPPTNPSPPINPSPPYPSFHSSLYSLRRKFKWKWRVF